MEDVNDLPSPFDSFWETYSMPKTHGKGEAHDKKSPKLAEDPV